MKFTKLWAALALLLLLTACAGNTDAPADPTPDQPSPAVTDAVEFPAPTPEAEQTPAPSAEVTPDVTPEPEATPEQTPVPEQTPEATSEPETTPEPGVEPTFEPTPIPTPEPTPEPTPSHVHAYTETVVAPTTQAKGYTLHTCQTCGDSYQDNYVDKLPAVTAVQQEIMDNFLAANPIGLHRGYVEDFTGVTHTMAEHNLKVTEYAPSCMEVGFTYHQCYECGFRAFTDPQYPIGFHSYTATQVVEPTVGSPGYTVYTCSVCKDSYKDDYVQAIWSPDGWKGDDYGSGETIVGNGQIAGQFVDNSKYTRKFYTPGMGREGAIEAINKYLIGVFGGPHYFNDGIKVNYEDTANISKFVEDENGRVGINVFSWRKSYDSSATTNEDLNITMEAFYFMCGDKDVAYALWSWVDAMEINGRTNSDNYGFHDVVWNDSQKIIEMNGIQIEYVPGNGNGNTFYFG